MNFRLIPLKAFKKFMKERTQKERVNIDNKLMILAKDPKSELLDIKLLKGYRDRFRLRVGNYRFLYSVIDSDLIIYMENGGNRGDIY